MKYRTAIFAIWLLGGIFFFTMDIFPLRVALVGISVNEAIKVPVYIFIICHTLNHALKTNITAWKLICIGAVCWFPGQVILVFAPFGEQSTSYSNNQADFFLVLTMMFIISGIILLGLHGLKKREKIQIVVHSFTFGTCVAFIGIAIIAQTLVTDTSRLLSTHWFDFITFTIDVILISLSISFILYRKRDKVVSIISLGLILQASADALFVISRFQDNFFTRPLQRLFVWSALALWIFGTSHKNGTPQQTGNTRSDMKLAMVAYVMIGSIIIFGILNVNSVDQVPEVVLYSFLLMFIAILVAQIIGYFDNKKLVEHQQQSIYEISKSEERYQVLATHDTLTDLVNRSYFIECLEETLNDLKPNENLAVMFIDLDRFKEINDTYGHESGDMVIKTIAHRIQGVVGDKGIVCRLGGDEFAILIPPPAQRDLTFDIALNALKAVVKPVEIFENEMYLTCSIGIAFSDDKENSEPQGLLRNADAAMYRAKELGRNRIEYAQEVLKPARETSGWSLSDLHKAVAQGQIEIYFQPIIDLQSNRTVSFEALARWNHPTYGYISPDEFIPAAEDNGLIGDLGESVIRQALAQLEKWQKEHGSSSMNININLSARQLNDTNFMPDLLKNCARYNISPSRIFFEMSESALLSDARGVMSILNELKTQGFKVLIDDFGTGYSSLAYLKKFPITGFKIDRTFIQGYGSDDNDTAIVNSLIGLGKTMGLLVIAEGVQSNEIKDAIKDLGCVQAQGYLFSEALKSDEVPISMVRGTTLKSVESA